MPAEKDDIETQEQGEGAAVLGKRAHETEAEPAATGDESGKATNTQRTLCFFLPDNDRLTRPTAGQHLHTMNRFRG